MNNLAISLNNVGKNFGRVKALDGVSFAVEKGTLTALLGPNGAGKSTLIKILTTLLRPDFGEVKVCGFDVLYEGKKIRKIIGLAGQSVAVDEYLTGAENLELIGSLYHLGFKEVQIRKKELLEQFDLVEVANRRTKTYSGGMRRRLDLALSLIGKPDILFLDEPTTGLDPRSRLNLWNIITGLLRRGTTILLTTQYMEEADRLAEKVAVIDMGKIIAYGTTAELKTMVPLEKPTLDDVFLSLTGHKAKEEEKIDYEI